MSIRGTRLIREHYIPFLQEIDHVIGADARMVLATEYDFMDAWIAGMEPREALHQALEVFIEQQAGPCVRAGDIQ